MKRSIDRIIVPALLAVTAAGFFLRMQCLGCLGFRWDEDLTALATKAIMQSGIPELPSGMIYLRFLPYQYVLAASASLFGFSEWSIRLPGVLMGTALIALAYWLAARLHGRGVGLAVAACIAFSFWEVEMARTARMYAPFFVVWLLAAGSIYRIYIENPRRIFAFTPLALSLLALTLHQLAYSLALLFLLPIFINPAHSRRNVSLVLQAGAMGGAFLAFQRIHQHFFYLAERNARGSDTRWPDEAVATSEGLTAQLVDAASGILSQFAMPNLAGLQSLSGIAGISFAVVLAALTLWSLVRVCGRVSPAEPMAQRVLFGVTLLCAALHQFNLVLALFFAVILSRRAGLATIRQPAVQRLVRHVVILLLFWLAVLAAVAANIAELPGLSDLGPRKLLRVLADYPNFRLFWSFVMERPALAILLGAGTAWCLDKAARPEPEPAATFTLLSFWLVLFCNGALASKFEFFRYNLHLDTFYFCLVVIGFIKFPEMVRMLAPAWSHRLGNPPVRNALIVTGLALFLVALNPVRTWMATQRSYSESGPLYRAWDLAQYPDFKTTGEYVRQQAGPDDIIIALESREYFNYIGRLDYWLWDSDERAQTYYDDGVFRDLYIGVPVIEELSQLESIVNGPRTGAVWILFSRDFLERTDWVPAEIKHWLRSLPVMPAYVGQDGVSVVYRID